MADDNTTIQEITANPNQKVYDTPHLVDHLVDVIDIYFAKKVKKYKWVAKDENYTVKSGGAIADVAKKYENKDRRNIQVTPNDGKPLKPKQVLKVTWEEKVDDGYEYIKIQKTNLAKKVSVVTKCNGLNGKLSIDIFENKYSEKEDIFDNPIKFLIGENEKTKIEFEITREKTEYVQEIILRPKTDDDLLLLIDKFNARQNKLGYIYLKGEVTDTSDEIKFPDETHEFLNTENNKFEVKYCECIKYKFENEMLSGANVITTKAGSLVKNYDGLQTVKAVILHRTTGSTTAGAVAETIGTHFYVDRGANDGEIYQSAAVNRYTNHIMNKTARTSHFDIQTENAIGIEVVGMAYVYNDKNELENVYGTKIKNPENTSLSVGYLDEDKKTYYWDQLTDKQISSVKCLVVLLLEKFNLTINDIYTHEEIQSKTAGEGAVVKDAILEKVKDCI